MFPKIDWSWLNYHLNEFRLKTLKHWILGLCHCFVFLLTFQMMNWTFLHCFNVLHWTAVAVSCNVVNVSMYRSLFLLSFHPPFCFYLCMPILCVVLSDFISSFPHSFCFECFTLRIYIKVMKLLIYLYWICMVCCVRLPFFVCLIYLLMFSWAWTMGAGVLLRALDNITCFKWEHKVVTLRFFVSVSVSWAWIPVKCV